MPQQVDPFIPISRPQQRTAAASPRALQGQYGQHLFKRNEPAARPHAPRPRGGAAIDGFKPAGYPPRRSMYDQRLRRPHAVARDTDPAIIARPQHAPVKTPAAAPPTASEKAPESRLKRLGRRLELPLFLLAAVAVGLLVQSLIFGEVLIVAYAIYALVRRVASRTTFLLAMLTIACIVLLLVVRTNNTLATHFAVYAFLLLAVGTITLGREIRQES